MCDKGVLFYRIRDPGDADRGIYESVGENQEKVTEGKVSVKEVMLK